MEIALFLLLCCMEERKSSLEVIDISYSTYTLLNYLNYFRATCMDKNAQNEDGVSV